MNSYKECRDGNIISSTNSYMNQSNLVHTPMQLFIYHVSAQAGENSFVVVVVVYDILFGV